MTASLATPVFAACDAHLTVVVSERIKVKVTAQRSTELLCNVASQLGMDPASIRIVLVQIHPEEAATADITPDNPIREVHSTNRPVNVYYAYVIGNTDDYQIAGLLGSAPADSTAVRPPAEQFRTAVRKAVIMTEATVNKNSLLKQSR